MSQASVDETKRCLREFYFQILTPSKFDAWLCAHPNLEGIVGEDVYFELIDVDYSDDTAAHSAKHIVEKIYRETLQGDLVRDRVIDLLRMMLDGSLTLRNGCVELWELRLNGADFIPAVFAGYGGELESSCDDSFYRDRILNDSRQFLQDIQSE